MQRILVGVTGGISAYKTVELCRIFKKNGFAIKVVMTKEATKFVNPITFRAITGNPVAIEMFADASDPVPHISLAKEADAVVIAPATANIMAKHACGIADDLLSTVLLSVRAPVFIAPAMNHHMFNNPATAKNIEILKSRGINILGPERGELACSEEGEGRMTEPSDIAREVMKAIGIQMSLSGKRIIVTAGGTREPIDPVRFIGNRSSGKMGHAIAQTASIMGASVTLITTASFYGNVDELIEVETAEQMHKAVVEKFKDCNALIMAAAVADYKPSLVESKKIKKSGSGIDIELEPTIDIIAEASVSRSKGQIIVGFSAETDNLLENSRKKLEKKNLDLIVGNDVTVDGSGFGSDNNKAVLIDSTGEAEELSLISKMELARIILERLVRIFESGNKC